MTDWWFVPHAPLDSFVPKDALIVRPGSRDNCRDFRVTLHLWRSRSAKQLGSYEVLSEIGKGGMGEVYRARDTRLDRSVAIKTLPEEFETDADRLARFEREAKVLASLNHPNIAQFTASRNTTAGTSWFSNWSKARPWLTLWLGGLYPWTTRCGWRSRLPKHHRRRTRKASL